MNKYKVFFSGIGISNFDISLKAIKTSEKCDKIYIDTYTSRVTDDLVSDLEKILKKDIIKLSRSDLEENSLEIINMTKKGNIMILVPGDPMMFTTHNSFIIDCIKLGIKCDIIHSASIYSAAISSSGLQASKFGRSITLPMSFNEDVYKHLFKDVLENKTKGLHTLVLLEICDKEYLSPELALKRFMKFNTIENALVLSKIGHSDQRIKYGKIKELSKDKFDIPASIIFTGILHFKEKEILEYFK